MRRRIYHDLLSWKVREDRRPLILEGVRQCGKTYILKEFGKREFEHLAYLDLERRRDLHPLFGDDIDPKRIMTNLSTALGRRIVPGRTLIVLDEVQACPRALTALKYFCEEVPEQHIVCAGSLLGILTSRSGSVPVGKVDRLRMYPMSFLEFLDACGEQALCDMLLSMGPGEVPNPAFRQRLDGYLRQYYVVGGLPDVVSTWVDNHNEAAVTRKLRTILRDYRDDFAEHAPDDLQRLTDIWDSIPVQLAKDNSRFLFSQARKGGHAAKLSESLQWILDAGLAYKVPLVESPAVPLAGVCDESVFKVYLCDVGLMRVMSGRKASFIRSDRQEDSLYKGAMTENFVLCQMLSGGLGGAFFWKKGGSEVDFLVDGPDGAVPLEVKSESPGRHGSLDEYMGRYSPSASFLVSMEPGHGGAAKGVHLSCAELLPSYIAGEEVAGVRPAQTSRPYVKAFACSDWCRDGDGSLMRIGRREHGIFMPSIVQVYRKGEAGFSEVYTTRTVTADGDVVLRSPSPFDGFVSVIRRPRSATLASSSSPTGAVGHTSQSAGPHDDSMHSSASSFFRPSQNPIQYLRRCESALRPCSSGRRGQPAT